ncbi:MAG TPA: phosphoribosylformylglycinamidine synthase subunit PurQ [Spirochaetota bacterium]|nr:phosphoribosylformylglycinamidine synthase subunit PurQ [Spirochaetota bacterium]HNT12598.1 phosphoribosylformylglycinamidine synthase subunit PurQ [Spirochaetota bacterium]HNV46747.1 phosphoribosylformylglycinamidine synthase subunit PurQ [Spirochaetota bacterium]HPU87734.1 phosphoribosylformylglycinamidine synthase subunit PurQ [Spirochaetota bacterium]
MKAQTTSTAQPRTLVLTGYGINCDNETRYAFERAGARADIVHINDIIETPSMLDGYQIFSFPGGFSYGDDTGSGKALANRIKNNLLDEFLAFVGRDTLVLGICNGFQVMANLGLVPALGGFRGDAEVSLEHNESSRYECRWVDLAVERACPSVFIRGIERLHIPIAHGEGNFYAPEEILAAIETRYLACMRYVLPDGSPANGVFPHNPNGALHDIAAVCDPSGRLMGMMPHPERNILPTHRDDWTLRREHARRDGVTLPEEGEGMAIFRNAVGYFR